MKIIELIIDETDEQSGIEAISLVEQPAIESNFVALNKQEVLLKEIDEDKRILMGPALIPDKSIYRRNDDGQEYYIYFSQNTVRKASELFFKKSNHRNATFEHKDKINGVTFVESWIVENKDKDKTALYGMDVPVGTWMVSAKIDDEELYQKAKSGEVKGFSIEGYFADKYEMSKRNDAKEEIIEALRDLLEVKAESYSDYPQGVSNNAKRGIELNKKVNNKCATQVGKVRAQQLANREPVSVATIKRMYSYLSRAETYYEQGDQNDCGYISYLLWGGKAGKRWAESKLKQIEKLAEVGPKGGVKRSKKAPKSDTPNKNPKGKGSAKGDASTSRGAVVSKADEESLKKKSTEFNERYKDKLGYGANVGSLKTVFQRGLGAFNTSHSPKVKSAKQWAMARVNAFLYLLKNGRPQNPKYTGDYDLLPAKHPKSKK